MSEYVVPGAYVEDVGTGPPPIEGVSTSVAGFAGPTERGPEGVRAVTSWPDFNHWYGGHLPVATTYMVHAVRGFFDDGGRRCFVARVVSASAPAPAALALGNLTAVAIGRGAWGNRVFVRVEPASRVKANVPEAVAGKWVRVRVIYFADPPPVSPPVDPFDPLARVDPDGREPAAAEDYDDVGFDPAAENFVATAINSASGLIRLQVPGDRAIQPVDPGNAYAPLTGGGDGDPPTLADYQGNLAPLLAGSALPGVGRGLAALDAIDEVSLVLAPDQVTVAGLTEDVVARCERLRDRFAVLSVPADFPTAGPTRRPAVDTSFGAQYYPWIEVSDPSSGDGVLVPPAGHVAGVIARTDLEQGVHRAPVNAVVVGARALQRPVTKEDQDVLNPVGINCLRDFRSDGRGIRLWGARTMSSDPDWKYVNVRRLFLAVEGSIDEGTRWVAFEPNTEATCARVVRAVTGFLTTVWRTGGLAGATPDEAFFVRCDRTTMTQDDVENGRLVCLVGIAPVRPAEFVIFRVGQKALDAGG
jgi:uncharacterized protein